MEKLTFNELKNAIAGNHAAIRLKLKLDPAGGSGSKVFPPTHSGGVYAWERRRIGPKPEDIIMTVLLDSVQSQANRMEQALLKAYKSSPNLPIIEVNFSMFPDIGTVTTLDAPHRIADAIFRDSLTQDGKKFRESEIGQAFEQATIRNATAMFRYCPTALIFGVWDSTGSAGGLGNKFQRAIVSEIVGYNAEKGVRTNSRIDPAIRKNPEIYKATKGDWTSDQAEAEKNSEDIPLKFGKKLSELNLGNVTPDFARYNPKEKKTLKTMYEEIRVDDVLPGGVSIEFAEQTVVLSFPALRRLHFPVDGKEPKETVECNSAARVVLAALALAGVVYQYEQGYDLRSRCLLIPQENPIFELIAVNGKIEQRTLRSNEADDLLKSALKAAQIFDLPWQTKPVKLTPDDKLVKLVEASRKSIEGE